MIKKQADANLVISIFLIAGWSSVLPVNADQDQTKQQDRAEAKPQTKTGDRHNMFSPYKFAVDEVDRLAESAYEERKVDPVEAEKLFEKALALNEPLADETHKGREFFIVENLISIYKGLEEYSKAEELYETLGWSHWNADDVNEQVAELLIRQHKYKEARAILRKLVPAVKPPTGPGCGRPLAQDQKLKEMMNVCERNTPDLTEEQWTEV